MKESLNTLHRRPIQWLALLPWFSFLLTDAMTTPQRLLTATVANQITLFIGCHYYRGSSGEILSRLGLPWITLSMFIFLLRITLHTFWHSVTRNHVWRCSTCCFVFVWNLVSWPKKRNTGSLEIDLDYELVIDTVMVWRELPQRYDILGVLCSLIHSFTDAYSPGRTFGLPFRGVLITHTYRHTVGLLWTSDQPVAETSTYTGQHNI
jgi:hypothetical protein